MASRHWRNYKHDATLRTAQFSNHLLFTQKTKTSSGSCFHQRNMHHVFGDTFRFMRHLHETTLASPSLRLSKTSLPEASVNTRTSSSSFPISRRQLFDHTLVPWTRNLLYPLPDSHAVAAQSQPLKCSERGVPLLITCVKRVEVFSPRTVQTKKRPDLPHGWTTVHNCLAVLMWPIGTSALRWSTSIIAHTSYQRGCAPPQQPTEVCGVLRFHFSVFPVFPFFLFSCFSSKFVSLPALVSVFCQMFPP